MDAPVNAFLDKFSRFTQRQTQALLKPCPSVDHLLSTCLQTTFENYSTLLGVVLDNGRVCWHASVARFDPETRQVILLDQQSPKQLRQLSNVGREMLYTSDGKGSVGEGKHYVVTGIAGIVVVRQLSEFERSLLSPGWEHEPTDQEIRSQS